RLVHHVEHDLQTLTGLADAIADGSGALAVDTAGTAQRNAAFAEIEQRVRYASITELVVEPRERDVVALAGQASVCVDHEARHREERDALGPGNGLASRAGNLREHEVHDVLTQVVLATGNPHLVALEPVARAERIGFEVRAVGHRDGRDVAEARSGLRLAQAHRAEESALDLRRREGFA